MIVIRLNMGERVMNDKQKHISLPAAGSGIDRQRARSCPHLIPYSAK